MAAAAALIITAGSSALAVLPLDGVYNRFDEMSLTDGTYGAEFNEAAVGLIDPDALADLDRDYDGFDVALDTAPDAQLMGVDEGLEADPDLTDNLLDTVLAFRLDGPSGPDNGPDTDPQAEIKANLEAAMKAIRHTKAPTKLESSGKLAQGKGATGVEREIKGADGVVQDAKAAVAEAREAIEQAPAEPEPAMAAGPDPAAERQVAAAEASQPQMRAPAVDLMNAGKGSMVTHQQSARELASSLDDAAPGYQAAEAAPVQTVDVMARPGEPPAFTGREMDERLSNIPGEIEYVVEPGLDYLQLDVETLDRLEAEIAELEHEVLEARADLEHYLETPVAVTIGGDNHANERTVDEQTLAELQDPRLQQQQPQTPIMAAPTAFG